MSGGYRSGAGRPAEPDAIRRDRKGDHIGATFVYLPAAYEGPVPDWPLIRPRARELALWASEWKRPQASEWARLHLEHEVAIYVRMFVRVERPNAPTSLAQLLLRMQADLGLTPGGMRALRWILRRPDELPAPVTLRSCRAGARARFRALEDET